MDFFNEATMRIIGKMNISDVKNWKAVESDHPGKTSAQYPHSSIFKS